MLALVLVLAVPGVSAAQPAACPQFSPGGQLPALLNSKLAQRATVLCNDGYAVGGIGCHARGALVGRAFDGGRRLGRPGHAPGRHIPRR